MFFYAQVSTQTLFCLTIHITASLRTFCRLHGLASLVQKSSIMVLKMWKRLKNTGIDTKCLFHIHVKPIVTQESSSQWKLNICHYST